MKQKIIIVSGYFNPIHKGHIEYFHLAKSKGDVLFVIVNNDIQRKLKGSKKFMSEKERLIIVNELSVTNKALLSIDKDLTVCRSLEKIYKDYSSEGKLFFANGGDQDNNNIPEFDICKKLGIGLIDGLGKKIQSSSWLLKNRNENK